MDAFVSHPESGGLFPAVVILMDIWGLREELFDIARQVATAGYHCMVPNFCYRQGQVRFEFRDSNGRMMSLEHIPAEAQQRMREQMRSSPTRWPWPTSARCCGFLERSRSSPGAKGSIGYCLGGPLRAAGGGALSGRFPRHASLHGTRLASDAPLSPHKHAGRCAARSTAALPSMTTLRRRRRARRWKTRLRAARMSATARCCTRPRCTAMRCPTATSTTSMRPIATGRTSSRCSAAPWAASVPVPNFASLRGAPGEIRNHKEHSQNQWFLVRLMDLNFLQDIAAN